MLINIICFFLFNLNSIIHTNSKKKNFAIFAILCRFYTVFMPLVERKDRYNGAESRADGVKNVGSAEQG